MAVQVRRKKRGFFEQKKSTSARSVAKRIIRERGAQTVLRDQKGQVGSAWFEPFAKKGDLVGVKVKKRPMIGIRVGNSSLFCVSKKIDVCK